MVAMAAMAAFLRRNLLPEICAYYLYVTVGNERVVFGQSERLLYLPTASQIHFEHDVELVFLWYDTVFVKEHAHDG